MHHIQLPDHVWNDVEEGTEALLDEWRVKEGDSVSEGQVLGVAELVKTAHEIVSPVTGKLVSIKVAGQETFGRDAILAVVEP